MNLRNIINSVNIAKIAKFLKYCHKEKFIQQLIIELIDFY